MSKFNIQINTDSREELAQIIEALKYSNNKKIENVEVKTEKIEPAPKKKTKKTKEEVSSQQVPDIEQQAVTTSIPVAQSMQSVVPVAPQPLQPQMAIPTTQVAPIYTYEQIARAMALALEIGKQDLVFNGVLAQFNAKSLMEINSEDYGQVALILQQNGVNV